MFIHFYNQNEYELNVKSLFMNQKHVKKLRLKLFITVKYL